jgi:hypothetical protein
MAREPDDLEVLQRAVAMINEMAEAIRKRDLH